MYHENMATVLQICIHDVIDYVIRSQNRSNFEIDISPSIFELQRRPKAQNVGNAHGYLSGIFNFRYNFQIMPQKFFYGDDVIDDVTGGLKVSLYSCLGEVGSGSKL